MHYLYFSALSVSLAGLAFADLRAGHRLILQPSVRLAVGSTAALLLVADIIGIRLDIFHTNQAYVSGLYLWTPDLPVEELLFLLLTAYLPHLLGSWFER